MKRTNRGRCGGFFGQGPNSGSVPWACENFSDLAGVRRAYKCSAGFICTALYEQLELRLRQRQSPWPKVIDIDGRFFRPNSTFGFREFVSVLIDYRGRKMKELVHGRRLSSWNMRSRTSPDARTSNSSSWT
jgi:hypothetical protein